LETPDFGLGDTVRFVDEWGHIIYGDVFDRVADTLHVGNAISGKWNRFGAFRAVLEPLCLDARRCTVYRRYPRAIATAFHG